MKNAEKVIQTFVHRYHAPLNPSEPLLFQEISKSLKTARNVKKMNEVLDKLEASSAPDVEHRAQKNIYRRILEHIIFKNHSLTNSYMNECSELSIIIKIWSYVYEEFFGYDQKLFIQWGDTISPACKISGLDCKLDLRIISTVDGSSFDVLTGEAAKKTATTSKKYYSDKLKSVLTTKCHLNSFINE